MKTPRFISVCLAVCASIAFGQDRPSNYTVAPTPFGAIKVASWNMRWFPSGDKTPKPKPEEDKRTDSAARFLRWQNLDVVMFQEMRSAEVTSNLVNNAALEGFRVNVVSDFRPPYRNADAYHQNAIISKYPTVDAGFKEWTRRGKGEGAPPRGLVWAVLDIKGDLVAFITVHLKSNLIMPWVEDKDAEARSNTAKREESARQLVEFANTFKGKQYGNRYVQAIVIGGDFNTDPKQANFKDETTIPTVVNAGFADVFKDVPDSKRATLSETRSTPASCFDYLFHAGRGRLERPEVLPKQYTSDHAPVAVFLTLR
jgi:endonuclease/exonuclease/phosphatase family metal-dependent hydrolase